MEIWELVEKYRITPKGVIHVGAHFGGEIGAYNIVGFKNIIFFEPIRNSFEKLIENVESKNKDKDCKIIYTNKAIGNYIGESEMYVETSNQGMSSSLLKPLHHLVQYPYIQFPYRETVNVSTLNYELNLKEEIYNFLHIDVQGFELEVLKGATNILPNIDYINTEVNRVHMYENCPLVNEIDEFLYKYDFVKVEENWMGETWGDAVYIKRKFLQ